MPLTAFQTDVIHLLAVNRRPQSHVAGGIAIKRSATSPRYSADLDLFHDNVDDVGPSADRDAAVLVQNGFDLEWSLRLPNMRRAHIKRGNEYLAPSMFPMTPDPTSASFLSAIRHYGSVGGLQPRDE